MKNKLLSSLMFSALFVVIGTYLPIFYKTNIDPRIYYSQDNWIDTKIYHPCETLIIHSDSSSEVNTNAVLIKELWKEDLSDTAILVKEDIVSFAIQKGVFYRELPYNLPCDLEAGKYFHKRTFLYSVEDVSKEFVWISPVFEVK